MNRNENNSLTILRAKLVHPYFFTICGNDYDGAKLKNGIGFSKAHQKEKHILATIKYSEFDHNVQICERLVKLMSNYQGQLRELGFDNFWIFDKPCQCVAC